LLRQLRAWMEDLRQQRVRLLAAIRSFQGGDIMPRGGKWMAECGSNYSGNGDSPIQAIANMAEEVE